MTTFKTRYVRDQSNSGRVVTLVTKVDGYILTIAYAVNAVPCASLRRDYGIAGDRFQKKLGSKIAKGRLEAGSSWRVYFDSAKSHPFVVALTFLAGEKNSASRIAFKELRNMANGNNALAEAAQTAFASLKADRKARKAEKKERRRVAAANAAADNSLAYEIAKANATTA